MEVVRWETLKKETPNPRVGHRGNCIHVHILSIYPVLALHAHCQYYRYGFMQRLEVCHLMVLPSEAAKYVDGVYT
jgi:hypothetical protein